MGGRPSEPGRAEHGAAVVTPGNYDGVHLGHQALLAAARELTEGGAQVVALTFDPHPARLLAPDRAPPLLTTMERRRELLLARGADRVEVLRFDRALASKSPEAFVEEVLVERLRARGLVIGPDFRFGKGAKGDLALLEAMGAERGFAVRVVGSVLHDGDVVSSTRVRAELAAGRVARAASLLGRLHDVDGDVVRGDQRGRTIGVPTANLSCDPVQLPSDGVYAVVARRLGASEADSRPVWGVANLGVRPTMNAGRSVEVHLLDFDADLYDTRLRVGFAARLRGERKFDGLDALKAQIGEDIRDARARLRRTGEELLRWI